MVKIGNSLTESEQIKLKARASAGDVKSINVLKINSAKRNLSTTSSLSFGSGNLTSLRQAVDKMSLEDNYIYIRAELLMELVISGGLTISRLTLEQKIIIFAWLYKYDKKIGRIIDIFVNLPLSTLRLQKPTQTKNDILQDYVYAYFERFWNKVSFKKKLKKVFLYTKLFGVGALLLSDDYNEKSDTVIDFTNLKTLIQDEITEEEWEEIDKITKEYNNNPDKVSLEDKNKVISKLVRGVNNQYKGVEFAKVVNPFEVIKRKSNKDIDYHIYNISEDTHIKKFLESEMGVKLKRNPDDIVNMLKKINYSESYIKLFLNSNGMDGVQVDSNPYYSSCYIVSMEEEGLSNLDNSNFNRVLQSAIDLKMVRDRERMKSNEAYKVIRLVTIPEGELTPDQVAEFEAKVLDAAESPEGSVITTNYNVNWQEFRLDAREQIDLQGVELKAEQDINSTFGIADVLVGGEDSYANSFMKTEMMVNEFNASRMELKEFVEEKIFKPIAIKAGFVVKDEWGEPKPVYPSLKFDRISIARGSEDFALLQELASAGKLPWETIINALNFDYEEVQTKLRNEKMSILNDNIGAVIDNSAGGLAEQLSSNPEFLEKIADILQLKIDINKEPNTDEESQGDE